MRWILLFVIALGACQVFDETQVACTRDCRTLCNPDVECCVHCIPSSCFGEGKDVPYYEALGFTEQISDEMTLWPACED